MKKFLLGITLYASVTLVAMGERCCPSHMVCEYCAIRRASVGFFVCFAAAQTDIARIRVFLEEKIDLNRCMVDGMNPFFFATCAAIHRRRGAYEVMRLLAAHGADVNAVRTRDFSFPLLEAARGQNAWLVSELIKLGADLKKRHYGRTALWSLPMVSDRRPPCGRAAAFRMFTPTAVALIEHGASIESQDLCELNFLERVQWHWMRRQLYRDRINRDLMRDYVVEPYDRLLPAWLDGGGDSDDERTVTDSSSDSGISDVWISESNVEDCRFSCQKIEDAIERRHATDTLVGCDVARRLRTGQWLLPRELICRVASFLGIELPLQPRRRVRGRLCDR